MKHLVHSIILVILFVCSTHVILAQWTHDPSVNNAVSTAAFYQTDPQSISDGNGGVIITWQDSRGGQFKDIYAQRINKEGVVQWTANGVAISTAPMDQEMPQLVSDGSGGAIITWRDYANLTNYDILAQRINSAGVVQWAVNGVVVCDAQNEQSNPQLISDGSGGAIVAWKDYRSVTNYDIYAQKINSAGVVQWTAQGVPITTATGGQENPLLTSDGLGGAIIIWNEYRNVTPPDIYGQRINSTGAVQWTANGVSIVTAANFQTNPQLISDGLGGAIIAWDDSRTGLSYQVYAQRINSAGAGLWTTNGVAICPATENQYKPKLITDGSGGAIVTWKDYRASFANIYAQRINASGVAQWSSSGVELSTGSIDRESPIIVSDGVNGAIIAWRSGIFDVYEAYVDIYAQHVNSAGVVQWDAQGVAISTAMNNQSNPQISSDGSNGAIICWQDFRSGTTYDVYAQNVDRSGYIGDASAHITKVKDVINDQGGKVSVMWNASYVDAWPQQTILNYGIWRGVKPFSAVSGSVALNPEEYHQAHVSRSPSRAGEGKTYLKLPFSTNTADTIYWEYIDNVLPHWLSGYSYNVPTPSDSGPQGISKYYFMITTQTTSAIMYWDSAPDSGYSVDNIAPSSVLALTVQSQTNTSVTLQWNPNPSDPDIAHYDIYRRNPEGTTLMAQTKIGSTSNTVFTDNSYSSSIVNIYNIVGVDIHGNEGEPSADIIVNPSSTMSYSYAAKWNLVSIPLNLENYTKTTIYPTAVSEAFAYQGGYVVYATLANGVGYWLKFSESQSVSLHGLLRTSGIITVASGWNMVGSISSSIPVTSITSIPPGLVTSQFFGYADGYFISETIEPGRGYWVKVSQAGTLTLSSSFAKSAQESTIKIVGINELPPPPPGETNSNNSIIPSEFTLEQNYPNPFNPLTVIRYQLPVGQFGEAYYNVSLRVYNMLGEEVATLVNEFQSAEGGAGFKSVAFDASQLPSGVYTYRLVAGEYNATRTMVLMK
jgi:hypothetical protein